VLLTVGEGLLPLWRGESERGESERRGLETDLEWDSSEYGERERVRSRPRETDRDGIVKVVVEKMLIPGLGKYS